jgi:hypothetical protein
MSKAGRIVDTGMQLSAFWQETKSCIYHYMFICFTGVAVQLVLTIVSCSLNRYLGGKNGEEWVEPYLCCHCIPSRLAQEQLYMFTVGGIVDVALDPFV